MHRFFWCITTYLKHIVVSSGCRYFGSILSLNTVSLETGPRATNDGHVHIVNWHYYTCT